MKRHHILVSLSFIVVIFTDFTQACVTRPGRRKRSEPTSPEVNYNLASFFGSCKPLRYASEGIFDSLQSVVDYVIRDSYWYKITLNQTCSGDRNKPGCWIFALYFLLDRSSPLFDSTAHCICDYAKTCWRPPKWNQIEMEKSILRNAKLYKTHQMKDATSKKLTECIDNEAVAYINQYSSLKRVDGLSIVTFLKYHYTYCRYLPDFPYEQRNLFQILYFKKACPMTEQSRNVIAVLAKATRRDGPIWRSIERCADKYSQSVPCRELNRISILQGDKFWDVKRNRNTISVTSTNNPTTFVIEFLDSNTAHPRIALRTDDFRYLAHHYNGYWGRVTLGSENVRSPNRLFEFILGKNGGYAIRVPNTMASLGNSFGTVYALSGRYEWNVSFADSNSASHHGSRRSIRSTCTVDNIVTIKDDIHLMAWNNMVHSITPTLTEITTEENYGEYAQWKTPVSPGSSYLNIRSFSQDKWFVAYRDQTFQMIDATEDTRDLNMEDDQGSGVWESRVYYQGNGKRFYIGHSVDVKDDKPDDKPDDVGRLYAEENPSNATNWICHVVRFCSSC